MAKTTAVKFLTDFSPAKALTSLKHIRSVPDVWENRTPSLAGLRKFYGEDFAINYLAYWIIQFNDMLNLTNKMNPTQIDITSRLVFNENPLLTIADIKLVFDRAVSGGFGEIYNRLDSAIICKWFRDYWQDRLDLAAEYSLEQHKQKMSSDKVERERQRK